MGNSSRPPFRIHAKTREGKITEAENWFIDALEEWRQARKIEHFTLLGHSLGGYLAVSYAIKYPGHLKKLILASPVGIPEDPYAVSASLPEPQESTIQNEFSQDQQTVTETHATAPSGQPKAAGNPPAPNDAAGPPKRPLPSWAVWLWDANVSPFSLVRLVGPFGPRIVSGWSSRRFNHLPEDEAQALHDYSFSIFKQKGQRRVCPRLYSCPRRICPQSRNQPHPRGWQTNHPSARWRRGSEGERHPNCLHVR